MKGFRVGASILAAAALLAACGGSQVSSSSSIATDPAASSTVVSPPGSNAGSSAATTQPTGSAVAVPVSTVPGRNGGDSIVTVAISVGGGAPVTVQLDTGSSGLLIDSTAVGSQVTDTGQQLNEGFVSGTVAATLAQAPVTIGGATTPSPIGIGLVQVGSGESPFGDTKGLLGIASANGPTLDTTLFSPSLQLPAPYDAGSVLDIAQTGTGTWTLGPVPEPAGAVALPFNAATGAPSSYPNGAAGFAKDLTLCWTIGSSGTFCGPTDFDLGNPTWALNSTTFASLGSSGSTLPAGTGITMTTPDKQPLTSFTTGQTPGQNLVVLAALGSATEFNTGIGYFFQNVIAFDYPNSRVLISTKSSP